MSRSSYAVTAFLLLSPSAVFAQAAGSLSQEAPDQWRMSKLPGVPIYGPDDKSVGKITDVLIGPDGKAQDVIVGVGGFLGIGQKDVAIPFDQVVFTDEPVKTPPSTMGGAPATGAAPANAVTGVPTSTAIGMGAPAGATGAGTAPALAGSPEAAPAMGGVAGKPLHTAYPDHGRINMTADQLKSAPAFKFAP